MKRNIFVFKLCLKFSPKLPQLPHSIQMIICGFNMILLEQLRVGIYYFLPLYPREMVCNTALFVKNYTAAENYLDIRCFGAACMSGNIKIVKSMILAGADNLSHGLKEACNAGNVEIAELLLLMGASVSYYCYYGKPAIFKLFCRYRHKLILQTISNGLNFCLDLESLNIIADMGFKKWDSGLATACYYNNIDMAQFMIEHGATNLNKALRMCCRQNSYYEMAKILVYHGATNLNEVLGYVCGDDEDMCNWLISHGANWCEPCESNHKN